MKFREVLARLNTMRSLIAAGADDTKLSDDDKLFIDSVHRIEFLEPVRECGCRNKYTDAVIVLYKRLKERGKMADKTKYELRAGILIWLDNNPYSRHNLTDEIAEKYLKKCPNDRDKFARVPETAGKPAPAPAPATEPKGNESENKEKGKGPDLNL